MAIDTALLASLPSLKMRADIVVQGVLSGLHGGPLQGQSVEFAEYKEYAPGDDLRRLDWKVFGKSDRYYVRKFEQETEAQAVLAVDASGSMAYASDSSGELSKFDVAATFAAALALILMRQQDPVSLIVFSGDGLRFVSFENGRGHMGTLLDVLESTKCSGRADFRRVAEKISGLFRRRTQVFLLSDLMDGTVALESLQSFFVLKKQGHGLSFAHILDPDELAPPFDGLVEFTSMEEAISPLTVRPEELRDAYLQGFNDFLDRAKSLSTAQGATYERIVGGSMLDEAVLNFIEARNRFCGRLTNGRR